MGPNKTLVHLDMGKGLINLFNFSYQDLKGPKLMN